jgi:hypothetical protein
LVKLAERLELGDIPSRPPLRRATVTNSELQEIRSVHTRAVTALNYLHRVAGRNDIHDIRVDPDVREMVDAMHKVEILLAPWAKKHPKIPAPLVPLPTREEILGTFVKGKK